MNTMDLSRVLLCWGKTLQGDQNPQSYHPALYHMIDAGNTARVFMEDSVSPRWKNTLQNLFGSDSIVWIPWAVSIHDIGKISSSFQWQSKLQVDRLWSEGFKLGQPLELHHSLVGQISLRYAQDCSLQISDQQKIILGETIGGHHGAFTPPGEARRSFAKMQRSEDQEWSLLRSIGFKALENVFLPAGFNNWAVPVNISTAIMGLTGFTILCDWLSSNSVKFPISVDIPLEDYLLLSRERALNAVRSAGFMQSSFSPITGSFSELFTEIAQPRPLQRAVDDIPDQILEKPCLVIIEAPTGEGKTEAALALAHRISLVQKTDEFYYALPTTATSNQMFGRVQDFLLNTLCLSTQANLVHSQAFLLDENPAFVPLANGENDEESGQSLEWFSSKKKALLAPFGVGTIDQAELGALNVAHNALRLVGLAGKTLILDEVHAYDMYMTTIIERLLSWLSKLGTSVVLLSATLPRARREALVRAYSSCANLCSDQADNYPCLIVANGNDIYYSSPEAAQPDRSIEIHWLEMDGDDPSQKAKWLYDHLEDHSCLCWITNTVERAQQIFQAFNQMAGSDVVRILIHSRFPMMVRDDIEKQLSLYFGPHGQRPNKAVVIGTQVLEQSLDLDFDMLVSDLAPADLLLQRAGRCHRHSWRPANARAKIYQKPSLYVYCHTKDDGVLNLSTDRLIYAEYILQKSWKILHTCNDFNLPEDYRRIVNNVYSDFVPEEGEEMRKSWERLIRQQNIDQAEAKLRLLPEPNPTLPFPAAISSLQFKEDEDHSAWVIASTRKGEESVLVIPLRKDGLYAFHDEISQPVRLDIPADRSVQIKFLKNGIRLNGNELCGALRQACQPLPLLFQKSTLLRSALPLWMEGNSAIVSSAKTKFLLELDPVLGMKLKRERISS